MAAKQDGKADLATTQAECAPADSLHALLLSGTKTSQSLNSDLAYPALRPFLLHNLFPLAGKDIL